MKVLLLHEFYQEPGGEDTVFRMESELLEKRGHFVRRLTENNKSINDLSKGQLAVRTVWNRSWRDRVDSALRSGSFDVVHAHNLFPLMSPAVYMACHDHGVPVVQTLHNYRLVCPVAKLWRDGRLCHECVGKVTSWPGVVHRCYRNSAGATAVTASMLAVHRLLDTHKFVSQFVALSDFAREQFVEGGLPAQKIVTKPNFVHPDPGCGAPWPRAGVIFIGRLVPEKGILTLIAAWRHFPQIRLTVVGSGSLERQIREIVREFDLEYSVDIRGQLSRTETIEALKESALLVAPSEWYEGFPLTVAEAYACGTPVLASNIGSLAEIVHHGRTGRLFSAGDIDDLTHQLSEALSDFNALEQLSKNCRSEFEEKYSADRNYERLLSIYRSVCSD